MIYLPKIIHQIWIGKQNTPPFALLNTWRRCAEQMNIEYILWTEQEICKRGMIFECQKQIDIIPEINGKADIMRWEILLHYGGVFIDADSICVEPLIDELFTITDIDTHPDDNEARVVELDNDDGVGGFSAFENEKVRGDLVATGTMGFTPNHPLVKDIVKWIQQPEQSTLLMTERAWRSVGPGCITRFLNTKRYAKTMVIYPSHYFIPIHYDKESVVYDGHHKVFAHQLWGTGEQTYNNGKMVDTIPDILCAPRGSVSILINSYNTERTYIHECLKSVQDQRGRFNMEVVWIDDGSSPTFCDELLEELRWFEETSRFITVKYERFAENQGTRCAINRGIELCSNELIFKMDSDDIMRNTRVITQMDFMLQHPNVVCCGAQIVMFDNNGINGEKRYIKTTEHPYYITEEHCTYWGWFMNHPTLCYRKWALETIGGYGIGENLGEDRCLEVKLWEYFGQGCIINLKETLVFYRIHPQQITYPKPIDLPFSAPA